MLSVSDTNGQERVTLRIFRDGAPMLDLDFHGRFAEVRRTFSRGRLSTPKNNKSRRVDLSLHLTETLKALLVERKKETLRQGWGEAPPWVFINHAPVPIQRPNFAGRVWPKLLAKAGLRQSGFMTCAIPLLACSFRTANP